MNRKQFFKKLGLGAIAIIATPTILADIKIKSDKKTLIDYDTGDCFTYEDFDDMMGRVFPDYITKTPHGIIYNEAPFVSYMKQRDGKLIFVSSKFHKGKSLEDLK